MDFSSITALLGSIKTAADIAKIIKESGYSLEKAEIKLQFAELISALADAKIQVSEIQLILSDKEIQVLDLQEALKTKGQIVWKSPYYLLIDESSQQGPFCQRCYDDSQKLIRLQNRERGAWYCTNCRNHFYETGFRISSD